MDFALLVKSQNDNGKKTFKTNIKQLGSALSVKAVDVEKRQIRVLASNADLDRDGERILPEAFKKRLDIYKANPVILAGHQHRLNDGTSSVVGKAVNIWIDNAGLWCIIEFAKTALGEEYWMLYKDGFMKAVSIGFAPLAWRDVDEDGKRVRIFEDAELFEISLVAVGSNRMALSKSQQQKVDWLTDKKILNDIKKQNPNLDENANEFAAALLGLKIVDGEYVEMTDKEFCCDEEESKEAAAGGQSESGRFALAKAVHPNGNYQENEFVALVSKR